MFCKFCGKELADGARFCIACGGFVGKEAPAAPQYEAPAVPQYEAPQYQAPAAPQYAAPAAPQYEAPQYQAPQYAAPAAPQYEAPQYTAPQYEAPQYAAPQYAAPAAAPAAPAAPQFEAPAAKKFNLLPFIAAAALGFFAFINLIVNLATDPHFAPIMDSLLCMGAAALFILTLLGVLKKDNLFYAIGMFALAASKLIYIGGIYWFVTVLLVPAFVLAGLYYILKGKLFGNPVKMIMAIAVWAMGFIMFIIYCAGGFGAWLIISSLIMAGAMGLSIFGYTPYKK